jgi:hypothetical protein
MTVKLPAIQSALTGSGALTAIVGARIYQTLAPEDVARPYVIWTLVSAVPENQLPYAPEDDDQRVQVDTFSESQTQARQAVQAAADACEAIGYIVFGPWFSFEDDTKLHRGSFDVEVWTKR